MRMLFVDTWGWLTFYDQHEAQHQRVTDWYRAFRLQGGQLYTTDYVLDETFTLLFKRLPFDQAGMLCSFWRLRDMQDTCS